IRMPPETNGPRTLHDAAALTAPTASLSLLMNSPIWKSNSDSSISGLLRPVHLPAEHMSSSVQNIWSSQKEPSGFGTQRSPMQVSHGPQLPQASPSGDGLPPMSQPVSGMPTPGSEITVKASS